MSSGRWTRDRVIKLRVKLGADSVLGPGKADLLDAVARCGSISAAAKDQAMSYRRAWLLIDEMNQALSQPVLATSGTGAELTQMGRTILDLYQRIESKASAAIADELAELETLRAPT